MEEKRQLSQAEELGVIEADTLLSGGRAQPQASSRFALLSHHLQWQSTAINSESHLGRMRPGMMWLGWHVTSVSSTRNPQPNHEKNTVPNSWPLLFDVTVNGKNKEILRNCHRAKECGVLGRILGQKERILGKKYENLNKAWSLVHNNVSTLMH